MEAGFRAPRSCRSCSTCRRSTSSPAPSRRAPTPSRWLFVGRLAPNKAQHDIVKAFAAYRRFHMPTRGSTSSAAGAKTATRRPCERFIHAPGSRRRGTLAGGVSPCRARRVLPRRPTSSSCAASTRASAYRCSRPCTIASRSSRSRRPPFPRRWARPACCSSVKDPCTIVAAVDACRRRRRLRAPAVDAGARRVRDFDVSRTGTAFVEAVTSARRHEVAREARRRHAPLRPRDRRWSRDCRPVCSRRGSRPDPASQSRCSPPARSTQPLGRTTTRAEPRTSTACGCTASRSPGRRAADFDVRTDLVVRRGRRVTEREQRGVDRKARTGRSRLDRGDRALRRRR